MPNLPEVSIFPFHVVMGNSFFFSQQLSALLINYGRQILGKKIGEHLCGVIIPKSKLYFFFLLFYGVSRPSDVLIKKKVEKYGKTEFRITVCILGSAPATSQASAFGPMRVAWALMSPALHWILVLSSSRVTLVKLIHSNRMTDSSLFQKLYSFI